MSSEPGKAGGPVEPERWQAKEADPESSPLPSAAPPAGERRGGGFTVREEIRTDYEPWARNGGLGAGTWPGYRRMIETWILPLLGDELLEDITVPLVETIKLKLGMPRCPDCEAKQQREDEQHRKRRGARRHERKRRFSCDRPGCGYGQSDAQVNSFVLVLGAVLTRARKMKRLRVHPLQADPDFVYQPPGRARSIVVRMPHAIEPICGFLNIAHAIAVRLELYLLLRPQEALALMYKDALDEDGNPRPQLTVNKRIVPDRTPGLHLVEGVLVPHYVKKGLKTERAGRRLKQWQFDRQPELWPQMGRWIRDLWLADGRPPFTTFVVRQSQGPNVGFPPPSPASWAYDHVNAAAEAAGVLYDPHDSNASYRHIGACMLAVGPGWPIPEIAAYMGNDPETCVHSYQHFYDKDVAPEYRGKSMEEIIDLAASLALRRPTAPLPSGRPGLRLIRGGQ